ncbi:polysaccharide pyruvyl transferase family protein [Novosphingobium sp. YJ-S2-02]|uniref:Polysaccharide pyruvyl transferase family protein n=1 Tax=Novosphingobium aureum TaxID=2792964 RepID=A0A931HEK6_9SPHN|nr:polysaccharide pyruvyl transferase family protein [Novosphingobium aureum]MBH0114334.1 polysaccharide pyruvyl transferase family protein [Novosphingobium aureum]
MRIGLLNHAFGRPNLGVDALSRSNIAILRSAAQRAGVEPEFVLFGKPGGDAPTDPDVSQGEFLRLRQLATGKAGPYRRAIGACDLVVDICAGDGFADIYGPSLFLIHNIGKWAAIRAGRPLVFAPQTIGPFEKRWSRAIARRIFNRATLTFARDGLSTATLHEMKVTSPFEEVIDVAFRLPFAEPAPRAADAPVRVGINVSGLLYRHGDRFKLTVDYPALTRRMIEAVSAMPGHEVWLVPHVIHDDDCDEDDFAVTEEVAAAYPGIKVAPRFRNSEEAKSFLAGLDFFSGGRMHACIGAISSGVPVAPIAYSRKFNGLFGTLEYDHLVDGRALDTDQALAEFLRLLAMREELAPKCQSALAIARGRLARYEEAMSALMADVVARRTS